MRQFFLDTADTRLPAAGDTVALDPDESHHLFTVLRGGRETTLHLVDGRGHRLTGVSTGKQGRQALVRIETVTADQREMKPPQLTLACAVVKGKRFEWAVEKAVELGVHRIIPLRCEHGVIDPREGKLNRWTAIMKSALKQCGRSWRPTLATPQTVAAAMTACAPGDIFFGAAPWEAPTREVRHWIGLLGEKPAVLPPTLGFFVGPEGGWSPAELEILAGGAHPVSLGPHVLRAETAVAAGLTAMQSVRQFWLDET